MFRSSRLHGISTRHIVLKSVARLRVLSWILGGIGGFVLLLAVPAVFEQLAALVFVAFGLAFLVGAYLAREPVFHIDLDEQALVARYAWHRHRWPLSDVISLTVSDGGRHPLRNSQTSFRTYPLDLFLGPATSVQRLNLTNDADYEGAIETGRQLAGILSVAFQVTTRKRGD